MSRPIPLTKRTERSRLQTVISGEVHERVTLYCAHYGITEARFFESAAVEKLDGSGDGKNLSRQLRRLNEQVEILSEHHHVFVQMWMRNTQLFTKAEQRAAREQTTALYELFLQQIRNNLSGARGFLSDYERRASEARGATGPSTTAERVSATPASAPPKAADHRERRAGGATELRVAATNPPPQTGA